MNQAIQQMLSRRAQLAALMVVAALVAAAFAALSPVRAADGDVDADEVSLQLLVYFPDDSDGVFPVRTSGTSGGQDRAEVEIELRVTVPYEGAVAVDPDIVFGLNAAAPSATPTGVTPFGTTSIYPSPASAGTVLVKQADPSTEATRGSSIGLNKGLTFNDPNNTTLFFANDGPNGSGPDGILGNGDDAAGTGSGFDVVLDCSDGNAAVTPAAAYTDSNRPRTDQTSDSKKTVTKSCFVKVRAGTATTWANPEIFLQGAANNTTYTITAKLQMLANILAVEWDEGGTGDAAEMDQRKAFGGNISSNPLLSTLTIDNGENEVADSSLRLATNNDQGAPCGSGATDAGKTCPRTISDRGADNSTTLNLSIINSENNASNWGGIRTIQVQTDKGDIQTGSYDPGASFTVGNTSAMRACFDVRICRWTIKENPNNPWGPNVQANAIPIVLQSKQGDTGTTRVRVLVSKRNGETLPQGDDDVVEITITGPATSFNMTAPTSTVHYAATTAAGDNRDQVKFGVSATDKSGEALTLGTGAIRSNWKVTNAAGQNKTSDFAGAGTMLDVSREMVTLSVTAADGAGTRLAPGVYTFEASIGSASALKDTAEFTVVGPAADDGVSLTADPPRPAGRLTNVTLAVTVNDAAGNPVADGTAVNIALSPAGGGTASLHDPTRGETLPTKNGMVASNVVVVTGGTTVVTATAGGKVDTLLVTASAQAVQETHDITGLTRLSGFSGWTPQNPTTAPQLFTSLATRGVGILWKWDPASEDWFRYAEVDGQPLPGAGMAFEIARGDILYIGGTN